MNEAKHPKLMVGRRQALKLGAGAFLPFVLPNAVGNVFAAAPEKPTGQVIVGFSQEPTVFNPHMPHIEVDDAIHWNVFDPLFGLDPEGNYYPALAAEVPTVENGGISADGKQWRVKLRDDVVWHDGTPFSAEDVKYTLELIVSDDFQSARRTGHELVRNIQVVSPTEITWEMASPYAPYPSILASTFIVPKHILSAVDDPNTAPFNNAPVGTGPFKWSERVAGDYITLVANDEYWGEGPHLERLVFKYIPDVTVLNTQFQTGDIDVIGLQGISPDRKAEADELEGKTVVLAASATIETITFNLERPQFKDPAVRRALYLAMDKAAIIDALYYGLPKPTESYMPQQSYFYNDNLPQHEFDIEKANQILDEAGWVRGSDGIRSKDGVRLSFSNSTTAGNKTREQMQQFLQQSFAEIGVEMTIANFPPAVMWGEYWGNSQFDSVVVGLPFLTGSDPDTSVYFKSDAISAQGGVGQNTWQYKNEKVDDLLDQGGGLFVQEDRKEIYQEIQRIIRDDLPFLPIFQYVRVRGHKDNLVGYTPNTNVRMTIWNAKDWYWM